MTGENRKTTLRPRTKEALRRYYEALHFALEREFTGFPEDQRVVALSQACLELEGRLLKVPNGEDLIETARWNALNADRRLFAATHEPATTGHKHVWGPVERARMTGNPHRKCQVDGCREITLDLSDEE